MTDSLQDFIDSLDSDPIVEKPKRKDRKTYPCGQCSGTGFFQGVRLHQEKEHCFACKGKGFFLKSPEKRAAAKARRELKKAEAKAEVINQYSNEHPELCAFLTASAEWSSFAADLHSAIQNGKGLSERQQQAAYSMMAKVAAKQEAKAQEKKQDQTEVDLAPIRDMFEKAVENGHKRPKYRAEGLIINRAPDAGRNPGALYVKNPEGDYLGKIIGTLFTPSREGKTYGASDYLRAIANDPLESALRYGRKTGTCSCCGRELTKHASIEAGIGPICKEKWGL